MPCFRYTFDFNAILPSMQKLKQKQKRLRWDRIGMAVAVVLLASFGIAAMAPDNAAFDGTESEGRMASLLESRPEEVVVETGVADAQGPFAEAEIQVVRETEKLKASAEPKPIEVAAPVEATVGPAPSGPLPRKGVAPCSCSKRTMKLARNPYTRHQQRARTLPGSFFVKNESELQAGFKRGDLVRVPTVGRGYHLDRLTHSEPFLLPSTMKTLETMADRFADAMEGTQDEGVSIRITSLTRTQSQQRRLRRRNANAFNGQSTHNYGASFDVAFIDRPNNNVKCGGPSWALQTILQEMQENGEILVIPEGNCMHITPLKP